jgi:Putative viral replication protein
MQLDSLPEQETEKKEYCQDSTHAGSDFKEDLKSVKVHNVNFSFRHCCFTINNPSETEIAILKLQVGDFVTKIKYLVWQHERGASGTLHIQGYAIGNRDYTLGQWKKYLTNRAHIERARGTPPENKLYCTKTETRVPETEPFEFGACPKKAQGARTDIEAVFEGEKRAGGKFLNLPRTLIHHVRIELTTFICVFDCHRLMCTAPADDAF